MATGIDVLEKSEQETNLWLNEIGQRLDTLDRRKAFNALRATLHAVRDRVGADNAVHLAAQLPLLIRGLFFENWRPSETPTREREKATFLANVDAEVIAASAATCSPKRRTPAGPAAAACTERRAARKVAARSVPG